MKFFFVKIILKYFKINILFYYLFARYPKLGGPPKVQQVNQIILVVYKIEFL